MPDRINATNVTLRALILRAYDKQEFRPVIDRTGFAGIFDCQLKWVNQPTGNADDVSFFTAVQEQLGLSLEPGTATVEVVVIDRAERPDPN